MNKEVEDAIINVKEEIKRVNKINHLTGTYITIDYLEILLNYIQEIETKNRLIKQESEAYAESMIRLDKKVKELEEDNNWYNEETIALNNRIMDLEEKLTRYENELDLDYVDNNFIEKKAVQESIHKERELAEAQTTYEVNEMWKQKIQDKVNMLKDEITSFYEEEQELGRYDTARLEMLETIEEKLLNEEE